MVPASNVARLERPAQGVLEPAPAVASGERRLVAVATQAWQFQFALAWSYPRLCYAVWCRLTTLDR